MQLLVRYPEHKLYKGEGTFNQWSQWMTGTNNLFSRENVLFVMLIKRKLDSDICCSSVGLLCSLLLQFFVFCMYTNKLQKYKGMYIRLLLWLNFYFRAFFSPLNESWSSLSKSASLDVFFSSQNKSVNG